ncbi:ATP-binding protein [SAR92 clade bacterium H231]|nr:ATP-binding protein [SAR92 clade bacterium H231]
MAQFKARARTLDMLGRQQIAGIPTALHELFKNAHDAYADNVEVDFFRKSNMLLLRDDGIGMTREEFESRWLVLGTESKINLKGLSVPPKAPDKKSRAVMGEKGIGRLAIATIGPQVLVLTRAERENKLSSITACFINWGMFELPGVDLDEIEIPVAEFKSVEKINEDAISELVGNVKKNLDAVAGKTAPTLVRRIRKELREFQAGAVNKLLSLPAGPSLQDSGQGTHFIISPVDSTLISDIEEDVTSRNKGATNLQRMLLGFSNTMRTEVDAPIKTEFRDHLLDGRTISRVGSQEFFTPSEYEIADHHIEGEFDEYGNFKGQLSIYHNQPKHIEIIFNQSGEKLECGPFKIDFAYVQGQKKDTTIPFDIYDSMVNKLDSIGGLYIYKNGIRILPYGNSDYDFLEIERRRTLSASYYFFSYRRMFGAIHITTKDNSALQEKAGREGFQSNKAYRQFREYLMDFFDRLAALYFREDGVYAEEWAEKRSSLQREYKAAEKRRKAVTAQKKTWQGNLDKFFEQIRENKPEQVFNSICEDLENRLQAMVEGFDLEDVATDIIKLEADINRDLREELENFIIKKPRGVGLTKKLEKDWRSYEKSFDETVMPTFHDAKTRIDQAIGDIAKKAKIHLDMRARLQASISSVRDYSFKKVIEEQAGAKSALEATELYVKDQIRSSRQILEETKAQIEKEISQADFAKMDKKSLEAMRLKLENKLDGVSSELKEKLETIKSQLKRVSDESMEANVSSDAAVAALETELEMLKDDYNESLEMAQLGMAVSVIHHEFESNIKGVRQSLQALQKWANKNKALKAMYEDMRNGFDHLDNYLSLFTPLDKRLRRRKTKITGEAISDFIKDLFGERLIRHNVALEVTPAFLEQSMSTYASVIYPVFVNVVDNAFYWLGQKDGVRTITLDTTNSGFSILDNGPGISPRDLPYVFEFGYTRKLAGRGMGLYIAKTSLIKEGLDITVSNDKKAGARFVIEPMEEKK